MRHRQADFALNLPENSSMHKHLHSAYTSLDGNEYFDVEEYSASENWIRVHIGKARTRTGRLVTITKRGEVTVRQEVT